MLNRSDFLTAADLPADEPPPISNGADSSLKGNLVCVTLSKFVTTQLPMREKIVDPIIPSKGIIMVYAARGVGKTHVAMGIAYCAAAGDGFLRWRAPKPRRVLFVDGEMPGPALQERAKAAIAHSNLKPPSEDYFRLVSMDMQALVTTLNLAVPADQRRIEDHIGDAEFLVLDNLSTLVNGGRENDADSWDSMQTWLLHLRRSNITAMLVHHAGRGDNARGTSKREDILDTVLHLKRPEDYDSEQGARFEVHITKGRSIHGDDALPFEARLVQRDGWDTWDTCVLRDRELDRVEEMTRDCMSVRDIAEELSISKSTVNRMQAKLRAEGRLA